MTLDEFLQKIDEEARGFEAYWRRGHKKHGAESFPLEMTCEEWWDLFLTDWITGS